MWKSGAQLWLLTAILLTVAMLLGRTGPGTYSPAALALVGISVLTLDSGGACSSFPVQFAHRCGSQKTTDSAGHYLSHRYRLRHCDAALDCPVWPTIFVPVVKPMPEQRFLIILIFLPRDFVGCANPIALAPAMTRPWRLRWSAARCPRKMDHGSLAWELDTHSR